jgi:putative addiction module component (TIGR02574 family)
VLWLPWGARRYDPHMSISAQPVEQHHPTGDVHQSDDEGEASCTSSVSTEADRILEAAMPLPDAERALIGAILLDSIGDGSTPEEIEASWLAEVKRRRDDLDAGRTHTVSWEEVMQELRAKIQRAREGLQP